jgi:hypothetical protein
MRRIVILTLATLASFRSLTAQAPPPSRTFLRGDVDGTGKATIADAIDILWFLFRGSPRLECLDAADADDNGGVDLADAVYLLHHLFAGGSAPPAPYPRCGLDLTADALGCALTSSCPGFYGLEPPSGGVFFVVERSEHMQGSGELNIAKREVIRVLTWAPDETPFGIFFADRGLAQFPEGSAPASRADVKAVSDAITFVHAAYGGSGICVKEALLAAIAMAARSPASANTIYYLGTGRGDCAGEESAYLRQTLDEVTAANAGRFPIFTVGELVRSEEAARFLDELAARNGGDFYLVDRD